MRMTGTQLKVARKRHNWTQVEAASRLQVSQPYLALLEKGDRRLTPSLARKAVQVFHASPCVLPAREPSANVDPQRLAEQLAALEYPGFAYMHGGVKRNPAEVLLTALSQGDLESRLTEALPWLVLHYATDLDTKWLVEKARLHNLSNRLGFVVDLALRSLENRGDMHSRRYNVLQDLKSELVTGRLAGEDTLCQSWLSQSERNWLRTARRPEAEFWNLLTDWRPEHLQYAE